MESKIIVTSSEELSLIIDRVFKKNLGKFTPVKEEPEEFLTLKEVQILLKKSKSTIGRWRKNGKIPEGEQIGKSFYFPKSSILKVLTGK